MKLKVKLSIPACCHFRYITNHWLCFTSPFVVCFSNKLQRAVNNLKDFNKRQNSNSCWGLELSSVAVCWSKHTLNVTLIYSVMSELSCVSVVLSCLEVGDMDKIMQSSQKADLNGLSAFLVLIFMPVTPFSPLWMLSFEKEAYIQHLWRPHEGLFLGCEMAPQSHQITASHYIAHEEFISHLN